MMKEHLKSIVQVRSRDANQLDIMPKGSDKSQLTFLSILGRAPTSSTTEPRLSESTSDVWSTGNSIHHPSELLDIFCMRGKHA